MYSPVSEDQKVAREIFPCHVLALARAELLLLEVRKQRLRRYIADRIAPVGHGARDARGQERLAKAGRARNSSERAPGAKLCA